MWLGERRGRCQIHRWSGVSEERLSPLAILLGANARRLWRGFRSRRLAARPGKSPRLAATIWYERMTRMLARKGWRKSSSHTPSEFLIGIEDEAMRESVAKFTRHYESARFGGSVEDAERLPELYEEISTTARR